MHRTGKPSRATSRDRIGAEVTRVVLARLANPLEGLVVEVSREIMYETFALSAHRPQLRPQFVARLAAVVSRADVLLYAHLIREFVPVGPLRTRVLAGRGYAGTHAVTRYASVTSGGCARRVAVSSTTTACSRHGSTGLQGLYPPWLAPPFWWARKQPAAPVAVRWRTPHRSVAGFDRSKHAIHMGLGLFGSMVGS